MSKDRTFLIKWKKEYIDLIQQIHPEWDEDKIKKYLNKVIDKRLENPECALVNNYLNKTAMTSLLDVYDYIEAKKPIIAGGGVLFRNQNEALNPPAIFLDGALTKRKQIKKGLKTAVPGSYEYMMIDLKQGTEKVVANSYYGASGNETSPFYNLFTALATTATGQSLISCMMCAFENFYSNNVKLYDIDDFLLYVRNSLHKKDAMDIEIRDMKAPEYSDLLRKIHDMFYDKKILRDSFIQRAIHNTLANLTELEKTKLYYSSNLFEFIKIPSVEKVILDIIYTAKSFKDPNDVPSEISDKLDYFWELLKAWVVYNYPSYNRISRLKFEKRKCVVTIDTDSNMLNINKWMKYLDTIIDIDKTVSKDENEIMYIKCNTLCYILTKYSQIILEDYAKIANIPQKYAPRLNMKNEFLYLRMILTNKKKSYCGLIRLREGNEILPEKLDVKGIQFIKSTASRETKAYFTKLAREILYSNPISGSEVLKKVKAFARYIETSILSGEKTFLNPLAVKEPEAYDKPFSNQGIRGTYVWNSLYPEKQISLPDKLIIAKVKLDKQANIEKLRMENPEIFEKLNSSVYGNPNCPFRDKGISVIAIPSQVERVPDWITPYIDKEKIINDNITKFHMVMESLGIKLLDTRSNNPHLTNIINF